MAALGLQLGMRERGLADRDFVRFPALRVVSPVLNPQLQMG